MNRKLRLTSVLAICFLLSLTIQPSTANSIGDSNDFSNSSITRDYWPTDGWVNSTPEEQGLDPIKLQEMVDYVTDEDYDIYSVVIIRNGYIALESYFKSYINANSTHLMYSVTKSFTSALIGICVDQGYITNTSQTLLSFFPEYNITNVDERRERITIEHLLTMRSGMAWDETSAPYNTPANDIYHINTGDGVEHSLNLDMEAEPGEYWHYNTGASHLLAAIVQQVTGMTTLDFAIENLFDPLGIDPVYWAQDMAGWYKGGFDLRMSTRNSAKFGYLFLNNGTWDGNQLISAEWVNASTTTITQVDDLQGYSKQWWTLPAHGVYFAAGLYGQYIFVAPEHDLVVAFNSRVDQYYPHIDLLTNYILPSLNVDSEDLGFADVVLISITIALVVPVIIAGVYWLRISKSR